MNQMVQVKAEVTHEKGLFFIGFLAPMFSISGSSNHLQTVRYLSVPKIPKEPVVFFLYLSKVA